MKGWLGQVSNEIITFRNVITGNKSEIQIAEGQTVKSLVEAAGIIAPGNQFSVRDKNGIAVDGDQSSEHANEVLQIGPQGNVTGGGGGGGGGDVYVNATDMIILSATLIPMFAAFFTELGKKLGRGAADKISHIRLRQNANNPAIVDVQVHSDRTLTIVEMSENLPDDARLALIELDFDDPAIRGKRLKWDNEAMNWAPVTNS
jgi:hypothetical protein